MADEIQFDAYCAASVSTNGARWVLMKFEGRLQGWIPKELGELEQDEVYEVIIRKKKK